MEHFENTDILEKFITIAVPWTHQHVAGTFSNQQQHQDRERGRRLPTVIHRAGRQRTLQ